MDTRNPNLYRVNSAAPEGTAMPTNDILLTIQDVAALLQVPVTWVYDRMRRSARERIPGLKLGKYWRFRKSEVLAWVELRKVS